MYKELGNRLLVRPFGFAADQSGPDSTLNGFMSTVSAHARIFAEIRVGSRPPSDQDLQGYQYVLWLHQGHTLSADRGCVKLSSL
jgi:hypothetical protein